MAGVALGLATILPARPGDRRRGSVAAFLAIVEAWEGAKTVRDDGRRQTYVLPAIILPLPTEAIDE